jgi:hypothetical protein
MSFASRAKTIQVWVTETRECVYVCEVFHYQLRSESGPPGFFCYERIRVEMLSFTIQMWSTLQNNIYCWIQ